MRICHLAASHTTFSGRMFQREALSARAAGLDVTIIGVADSFPADPPDHGCRVIPLPESSRIGKLFTAFRLFKLGRPEPCDVYHCHDLASLASGAALKLVTRRGLIYDAHENYPLTHAANMARNAVFRRFLRWLFSAYEWLFVRVADEVITVDPLIAHKFAKLGRVIHTVQNYPRLRAEESAHVQPDWNGRRVFISAGTLTNKISIFPVLTAIDCLRVRYPDVLLALIGSFADAAYRQRVEEFLTEHNLQSHVTLIEEVPFTAVPLYLRRSYAGLVLYSPTMPYGDNLMFPVKAIECMAAGIPLIVSSFRGLAMLVKRRRCGLSVDSTSAAEIEAAMEKLLSDRNLAHALGLAARHAFETRCNWEAVEPRLLASYVRVAALSISI
ncbi:MAG: glycosyltransferase [Terracidiphilus sp.]|jgi:glycosyltransferase involved in cell wall biosynthesis